MDRFQNKAMCFIPPTTTNQNNQNNFNNSDFNLNIEIKQEIPDIDFEEEKIEDTTTYDDGYHSKCGEIYISNINKEFSFYCSLCNANFINFNLFSRHILYGNHGTQLSFLNNNNNINNINNNNNNNNQLLQFNRGKDIKSINRNTFQQSNINDIPNISSPTVSFNSRNFLDIDNTRSNRIFHESIDFKPDNIENIKNDLEPAKCRICFKAFQSNRDLRAHFQICHTSDRQPNLYKQTQCEKKSNSNPLNNVVSVATFSLAVCSTPSNNQNSNLGRSENFSRENREFGRIKNAPENIRVKSFSSLKQDTDPLSLTPSLLSATNQDKTTPRFASKATTPLIISKTKGTYSSSNKYTGSAITHDTQKVSIIKASATIAEIANNESNEDANSSGGSDQLPGHCPYCPVKFQKMKYINFHLQKYHPEKIQENENNIKQSENCYQCEMCNKLFRRLDFYKKHMRKHPRNRQKFRTSKVSEPLLNENEKDQNEKIIKMSAEIVKEKNEVNFSEINEVIPSNSNSESGKITEKPTETVEHTEIKCRTRKRLKCQYCGKSFLKLNHLLLHERKHKPNCSVKCRVCEERYCFRAAYDNHMKQIHPDTEYQLNDNEIKILTWPKLSVSDLNSTKCDDFILPEEEMETSVINKKNCRFCPKIFKTVEYRILHEKAHTGTGNFTCKYCEQKFNSIGTMWSHQRNCPKKFEESNQASEFWQNYENRLRTAQVENEITKKSNETELVQPCAEISKVNFENKELKSCFKCTYCKRLFRRKANWLHHVRKHTGEKFECNICDYKTTSPFYLKSHIMKIHDYSKATKNTVQDLRKDPTSEANLNTAIEAATKTSLFKSKLLLQTLAKFDSITSEEKTESFKRLKLFKCKFCNEVYTKKHNLEEHLRVHLKSKQISIFDLYKCKYCNLRYKVKYQALLHEKKHRKQKLVECNLCAKSFNKYYIHYHKKIHHDSRIKLSHPPKLLKDIDGKEKEETKTENILVFECNICKKKLDSADLLKIHVNIDHKESESTSENPCSKVPLLLSVKSEESVTPLSEQITNSEEVEGNWTKKEKCKICAEIFDYHYLATHMRTHTVDNKPFKCDVCPRTFRFKSSLIRHSITVHTKKKKEKKNNMDVSTLSGKESLSSSAISSAPVKKSKKITIRTLIKDKKIPVVNGPPFKCPHEGCRKFFGRRLGFNKHYLLHLDTFKCKFCNRCFQTRKVLQKHINFHTEKLPYKCKICSKAFPVKHALIWHKRRNNCENPLAEESKVSYDCERCMKSFITKSTLRQHILENTCEFTKNEAKIATVPSEVQISVKEENVTIVETKLKCESCGEVFLNSCDLSIHCKKANCVPKAITTALSDLKEDKKPATMNLPTETCDVVQKIPPKCKCELCFKAFDTKIALSWHKRRRVCEVPSDFLCEYRVDESKETENKSVVVHKTEKLEGIQETKLEKETQNEELHCETAEEIKKEQYQCEVCFKVFVVKGFLLRHMKYYHPPLVEKDVVEINNETEINENENENGVESEENSNRRSTRKKVESETTKFQCQICLKKFETKGLLAGHTRTKACFKSSSCMSTLRAQKHPIKDGANAVNKCNLCNKVFANEGFLTFHVRNQICILKKDYIKIQPDLQNLNEENLLNKSDYQLDAHLNKEPVLHTITELKANQIPESLSVPESKIESKKRFTCKRCNKIFSTKVELAWHTRRRECFYKRKKYKLKTGLSVNQHASKIRKKLIDGIVSFRKISTERKILQKKVYKAAIQVYKKNKSVADMANKYHISKTVIYKRINALKELNVVPVDSNKTNLMKVENFNTDLANLEKQENGGNDKEAEKANVEPDIGAIATDTNKVLPKIDLTVLRNEKDKNMVRAIRNYVRDRKKGRKLPQRFYCDRYQIRKIHFYRKLFKLGLVRKKGPQKRDSDNISAIQETQRSFNIPKIEVEKQILQEQGTPPIAISSQTTSIVNISEQPHKGKRGRLPKCSEETVRKAVMEYRMGKGTQLQLCEKYNVGICAFHRMKKILLNELPNLESQLEKKEEVQETQINDDAKVEPTPIVDSTSSASKTLDVNISENISHSADEPSLKSQLYEEFKIHKPKRKVKMMNTEDLKRRRQAVMDVCGDLMVNRKSKYNIPGTKENVILMDAIGDVVHGIRSFSNAVKHYKISFYTLQRYLDKYNERIKNKKKTVTFQEGSDPGKNTSVENENRLSCTTDNNNENKTENPTENINENPMKKEDTISSSSSSSSSSSTSSHSSTESYSSDSTDSDSDTDTTSENNENINVKKTNDPTGKNIIPNISSSLKQQQRIVFDPTTGQYIVKKKYEGRGGKGKIRQTVYSKPGTKENTVLMAAINEIRTKGESIGYVAKKFQISIQTVNKYINLFEKQGIIPKFTGQRANELEFVRDNNNLASTIDSEPKSIEKTEVQIQCTNPIINTNPPIAGNTLNENTSKEEIKNTGSGNLANILKFPEIHPVVEKDCLNQNNNVKHLEHCFPTPNIGSQLNINVSLQKNVAIDLTGGNKTEVEQNVLKENSISCTKNEMENIKDLIRKPIYITQKMSSVQNTAVDSTNDKIIVGGLLTKPVENLQKDHRLVKSTIEIRKPTYLTQKPSTTVVQCPEIKPIPSSVDSNSIASVISKISELNKCPVIIKNVTVPDYSQIKVETRNPIISQILKPTEIAQKSFLPFIEKSSFSGDILGMNQNPKENDKIKEIQQLPNKFTGNLSEKSVTDIINISSETNKKEKCITQLEQHQNIKIRKPTYITQKSVCPPIKTILESGQHSDKQSITIQPVQKPPEQIIQITSTTTSHLLSQKQHSLNSNENKLGILPSLATSTSSPIISRKDVVKIGSCHPSTTKCMRLTDIPSESNEDDLIIEHAMRSLLEQDTELEIGNADSTTVAHKSQSTKTLCNTTQKSDGNSDRIVLKTSTKSLTPTCNTSKDSSNFNTQRLFDSKDSNFKSS
ncbi:uncharacterized protein LOC129612783 [Condylostylus longicornis]|uniref:uncharacterized protein LOC129612783 n=1 Tax=Condylostylus longicornis TaxID=2530218 RepID=UPI00244E2B0B|nr:uncharacterized protein LOC129612783 [Condylostylus longicornis]